MTRAEASLSELLPLANAGLTWRLDTRYRERLVFGLTSTHGRRRATVELARVRYSELPEQFLAFGLRPATAEDRNRLPPHLVHDRALAAVLLARVDGAPADYLFVAGAMAAREATAEVRGHSAAVGIDAAAVAEIGADRSTALAPAEDRVRWEDAPGIEKTFAGLQERLRSAAAHFGRTGSLIGVVDPSGELVGCVASSGAGELIVGRHERCGLRLPDEFVALRHLALSVRFDEAGRLHTSVWDLLTDVPFRLADGREARTAHATGPLFLRLGPYGLAVLPLSTALVGAWPTTPQVERLTMGPTEVDGVRSAQRATEPSQVRALDTDADLEEILAGRSSDAEAWGHVDARAPGVERRVPIGRADLGRGFLVCRYERCLVYVDHPSVSRVHLLVARVGEQIVALDSASTNGLSIDGEEVRRAVLGRKSQIRIADEVTLEIACGDLHATVRA